MSLAVLDPRTTQGEAYKLSDRLAALDAPQDRGGPVESADDLLRAIVAGADGQGRYYASPSLLNRLFWWQRVPLHVIRRWLSDLIERGEVEVAYLAHNCYDRHPCQVVTVLRRKRFARFADRRPIHHSVRVAVYTRDGFRCVTCGTDDGLTLDHIYPHSRGGDDTIENLQTMCQPCNSRKGARV